MNTLRKERASVLILSLWMIGLLTVFAVYLGLSVRQKLDFLGRMEARNKLYFIAEAGIKKAVSQIGNIDSTLTYISLSNSIFNDESEFANIDMGIGSFIVGGEYSPCSFNEATDGDGTAAEFFGVSDVAGRLNINTADRCQIRTLITEVLGLDDHVADIIASSIVDWRDADSQVTPNGAEDSYYKGLRQPYVCKNSPFQAVEELGLVRGVDRDVFNGLIPYVTFFGSGRVNINSASEPVLLSIGLSRGLVKKILSFRNGSDQLSATIDDLAFATVGDIITDIGKMYILGPSQENELNMAVSKGSLTVFSNIFHAQSQSKLVGKEQRCIINCVFEKNLLPDISRTGWILSWRVNFIN